MDEPAVLTGELEAPIEDVDEQLALAARSDPNAFGQLYRRHRLAVFRYLRARTTTADAAEELTAVTFERALAAMPRYRASGGGVLAWLFRIARNAAIDSGRRRSTTPVFEDVEDRRATIAPERVALENEERSTLVAAIDRLTPMQREAIHLRYAARLTAGEIGAVIGKSDQATQKLLSRALATIRENYRVDD
ncbi:MAG: sigma-70 family RNA polymerase sigma factor [Chloroflexota bacterium]